MTERKMSRRHYLTVVEGGKDQGRQSFFGDVGRIHTQYQYFSMRLRHLKRSEHPEGWYGGGYYNGRVTVRWLWTEENDYFAPEFTFSGESSGAIKIAVKVAKALQGLNRLDQTPEALRNALGAVVVEYVTDSYDTYRPLLDPNEPAMMALARAAQ